MIQSRLFTEVEWQMSEAFEDNRVFLHTHEDWACNLTRKGVFGKANLTIFPQSLRDFGAFYETRMLVIAPKRSYEAKDVVEELKSYRQIIDANRVWETKVEERSLFAINLRAIHTPPYKSIVSVAQKHKVEVRFICFEKAREAVWIVTRRPRRVHRFRAALGKIGSFEEFECPSIIRKIKGPQDMYYYFFLKTLGIRDERAIAVFNTIRHLITFNNPITSDVWKRYAPELNLNPTLMKNIFWNTCWQAIPTMSIINRNDDSHNPISPQPFL
jgi:hypothetical protein